jgi:hypothetical protein
MEYEYNVWGEDAEPGVMNDGSLGDEVCSICLYPITNPMGEKCYIKHLKMWLGSNGMNDYNIKTIVARIKKRLPVNNNNHDMCISCGKEHLSICSYCFVFSASKVLNDLGFAKHIEEDFEYMFSYKGEEYGE